MSHKLLVALGIAVGGFVLAGCQGESKQPVPVVKLPSATPETKKLEVLTPNTVVSAVIGIHAAKGTVRFGQTYDEAKEVFPMPSKGAYELRELPSQFPEEFEARGWETGNGDGFGAILKEGKVVAALYTEERSTESRLQEWLTLQQTGTGMVPRVPMRKGPVRTWTWMSYTQVLVVVATTTKTGLTISISAGDRAVLDALGMNASVLTGGVPVSDTQMGPPAATTPSPGTGEPSGGATPPPSADPSTTEPNTAPAEAPNP